MGPIKQFAFLLVYVFLSIVVVAKVTYDGFKVVRVPTGDNATVVQDIIERLSLDPWKFTWTSADILIPPNVLAAFHKEVDLAGLSATVIDPDVGASIAAAPIKNAGHPIPGREAVWLQDWFDDYHNFEEHLDWMTTLQQENPDRVAVFMNGLSNDPWPTGRAERNSVDDGHPMPIIHIKPFEEDSEQPAPAIVIYGSMHAREWITTMVVEWTALQLLKSEDDHASIFPRSRYNWYFVPFVNPDGFVHSIDKDRLWRKNRGVNEGSGCKGVDINRNFDYMWNTSNGGGASDVPCSEVFRGPSPGSTREFQRLKEDLGVINQTSPRINLFIDFHSYSQLILSPYAYTCHKDKHPKNHEKLQELMKGAAEALKKPYGTEFTVGAACETLYEASGVSIDYMHEVQKARHSLTFELRPSSRYGIGFVLPPEQIRPSVEETWEAIKYLADTIPFEDEDDEDADPEAAL